MVFMMSFFRRGRKYFFLLCGEGSFIQASDPQKETLWHSLHYSPLEGSMLHVNYTHSVSCAIK